MVERDNAKDVHLNMLEDVGAFDILDKGIHFSDTGIGNNVINMINALVGGFFDSVKGGLLNLAAFKSAPYTIYCISSFINFLGLYTSPSHFSLFYRFYSLFDRSANIYQRKRNTAREHTTTRILFRLIRQCKFTIWSMDRRPSCRPHR